MQFAKGVFITSMKRIQPSVQETCSDGSGAYYGIYRGKCKGSCNEPSHAWTHDNQKGLLPKLSAILEVGFMAQSYAQFVEDARMWLEGHDDVQTFLLVKVEEDSEHTKSSITDFSEEEIRSLLSIDNVEAFTAVPTNPNNLFGPTQINGLVCVGEMKIYLEVWKRGVAGARRRGPRYNLIPEKPSDEHDITMNDMFGLDELNGGNEKLLLDWNYLRLCLEHDFAELAVNRCQEAWYSLHNPDKQV